jgi:hypothetical protein
MRTLATLTFHGDPRSHEGDRHGLVRWKADGHVKMIHGVERRPCLAAERRHFFAGRVGAVNVHMTPMSGEIAPTTHVECGRQALAWRNRPVGTEAGGVATR